ncbi:MAG: hypothetical protein LC798_05490 [Chloroflexi bacterium]|nr:hypothetical protein [Chloroflexota bacterium]
MPELIGGDFSKPPPKFDFDALGVTDGRVYFFAKGTDYDSSEANFRLHLARYVEDHGGRYESKTIKRAGAVTGMEVRFIDVTAPAPGAGGQEAASADLAASDGGRGGEETPPGDEYAQREPEAPEAPVHEHEQPAAAVAATEPTPAEHERHGLLGRIRPHS